MTTFLANEKYRTPLGLIIDGKGLYTQVDHNKIDKRKTVYVARLFETIRRTRANIYWVNAGHQLADPLTKLYESSKDTHDALDIALRTGRIRIAYDSESYKKALMKTRQSEMRTAAGPTVAEDPEENFDVEPRGLQL